MINFFLNWNRFVVGQHVTLQDDVVSHLNVSRVTEQDGGEYACVASNSAGKAVHAARVNVYGLPYIREMPKVTAVAGSDLNIKCPVAGYPIESITWERGKLDISYNNILHFGTFYLLLNTSQLRKNKLHSVSPI